MKIIITESQLSFLVETENDKSISMMEEIKSSIDTYYLIMKKLMTVILLMFKQKNLSD